MEHRQLPPQASHPHEARLRRDEPIQNQQARTENLLQAKLDVATAQMSAVSAQSRLASQKEMDAIHQKVERELANVIGSTRGLRVVDPLAYTADEKKAKTRATLASSAPSTQPAVRASGIVVNPTAAERATASTTTRLVSSNGTSAQRSATTSSARGKGRGTTTTPTTTAGPANAASTHLSRTRTLSVDAGANSSNYTFGFPTPFPDSGIRSVVRWADVSFQEAQVAAVGPRVNLADLRAHELPNRVVVSVACYLLNEVLSRDATLQPLWAQLRAPIFDAVFSPQLLASHLARHQARLAQSDGAAHPSGVEDGVLPPLPLRTATYEDVSDYANYRLWTEEHVGATKDNQCLSARVDRLKAVVGNSRLVLLLAQRRVDTTRKRSVLLAWRAYTAQVKNQREVVSVYVTETRHRRLTESSFLRWRRLTVQNKLDEVREQYRALHKKWEVIADAHRQEVNALKEKLALEEHERQTMAVRDAALRAQINDSYAIESLALRTALSRKQTQCEHLLHHATRWERLAKTFRPAHVAAAVPKQLLTFGIQLRRFEDEFSGATAQNTRVFRLVNARATLTKFLLRWTNLVMGTSPYMNMWVNVKRLATRRDHAEVQLDASSRPYEEALTAAALSASNPEIFSSYSLVYLVRELRRLLDRERQERNPSAALQTVLGAARGGTDGASAGAAGAGGSGRTAASESLFSVSKAKQWLAELQQSPTQTQLELSLSDSEEEREDGAAAAAGEEAEEAETFAQATGEKNKAAASEAALQRQLFAELCEVLYLLTEEGARPSLLMQCPYLGSFFSTSLFAAVPSHPTALLWILSALFIGYVETFCSFENPYFRGQYPPYLRCGNEADLARRPNPALTTIETNEEMGLVRGALPTDMRNSSNNAIGGSGGRTTEAAQGTRVISRNSSVAKAPGGAAEPRRPAGSRGTAAGAVGAGAAGGGAGRSRLRRQDSVRDLGRVLPTKSVRVTKMADLELVRRGIDSADDILAYLGRDAAQESFLHNMNGEETDVEALMAGLEEEAAGAGAAGRPGSVRSTRPAQPGRADADNARTRRQLRRLAHGQTAGQSGSPPLPVIGFTGETVLNSDEDDVDNDTNEKSGRRPPLGEGMARSPSASFYTDLTAIEQRPHAAEKGTTKSAGRGKADLADVSDEDESGLADLGLRDDMNYLRAVLRAQETVESEKASTLLVSPKKNLFSAEELYTLFRLPPPSRAFDARAVLVQRDLKAVASANSSHTEVDRTAPSSDTSAATLPSAAEQATSAAAVMARQPTTAINAFLTYTLLDADRRQLWYGMARVVTSLITRLRILDTATSTNTATTAVSATKSKAWRQRKSEAMSGRSARSSSNRSASSRSSSFVGVPEDDPALTTARLAKPVRARSRRTAQSGTGGEDDADSLLVSVGSEGGKRGGSGKSTGAQAKRKKNSQETTTTTTTTTAPTGTALPPILQSSTSARFASVTAGSAAASALSQSPETAMTGVSARTQLAEALEQYNTRHGQGRADSDGEAGAMAETTDGASTRASTAPSTTTTTLADPAGTTRAPSTDMTRSRGPTTTTPAPVVRPASGGISAHSLVVHTQHANTTHYSSPPPLAPGVPGDVRLADPLTLAPSQDTGTTGRSSTRVAPGMPRTVPRTAQAGVNTQLLQPLVVHAPGSGGGKGAPREEPGAEEEAPTDSRSRPPSLPPGGANLGSSRYRFDLKRGN